MIIIETHFGKRHKCPDDYSLVGRSLPRSFKSKLCGSVAIYKKVDAQLKLRVITDNLFDTVVMEIEDSSSILVASYIPPSNTVYYTDIYFENLCVILDSFSTTKRLYIIGDLNSRIGNHFPKYGFNYLENPDDICNQNGKRLIEILKCYGKISVVNGICNRNRINDSKFLCIRIYVYTN